MPPHLDHERIRSYLVHVALISIVLAACAWIRFTFVLTEEVHEARVDLSAQIAAVNTAIQTTGNRLDSRSGDLTNALHTFGRRVDSNITDTRATIQNLGKSAQASTAKEVKETREVLSDKLDAATQNLAVVALKAEDPKVPVQVTAPPVIVAPSLPIPIAPVAPQPVPEKKKRGFWKRILPWN